jgi:leader peptidase (prepilin peptidase)/N-methyltransferase
VLTLVGWPYGVVLGFLFVLGSVIGSFLNVCIYRIPNHEKFWDQLRGLVHPPSTCPKCQNRLLFRDNIPIFGWLKLRGRCRFCQNSIAMRYPLIELLNGLLFVVVYWFEVPYGWGVSITDSILYSENGPQIIDGIWSNAAWLHWRYAYHMVLIEALLVASFIDLDLRIIPDGSTLPAMVIGIIGGGALAKVFLVPVWFQSPSVQNQILISVPEAWHWPTVAWPAWITTYPYLHGLSVSLAGLVVGGGIVWAVRIVGHWVLRQEAMGFGDVVLMAMIGSFIGWQPVILVFFIAPMCALTVVAISFVFRRDREIPYGPYLSLATLILLLSWKHIWPVMGERVFHFGPLVFVLAFIMLLAMAVSLYFMQLVKRMLGIPLGTTPRYEWVEDWTSADQLTHHSGERIDVQQGQWKRPQWDGANSGRGLTHDQQWRNGSTGGFGGHWNRRP